MDSPQPEEEFGWEKEECDILITFGLFLSIQSCILAFLYRLIQPNFQKAGHCCLLSEVHPAILSSRSHSGSPQLISPMFSWKQDGIMRNLGSNNLTKIFVEKQVSPGHNESKVLFCEMGLLCPRQYSLKYPHSENWNKLLKSVVYQKLLWNMEAEKMFPTSFHSYSVMFHLRISFAHKIWSPTLETYEVFEIEKGRWKIEKEQIKLSLSCWLKGVTTDEQTWFNTNLNSCGWTSLEAVSYPCSC